jgi:hypothetical protein
MQRLNDTAIDAFRFLSDKVIVVANHSEKSLDLFTLPEPQGDTGRTPMTKVAKLWLPNTSHPIIKMRFCNPPAKNGTPHGNRQIDDAAISIKPFTNAPDHIIYCCVTTNTNFTGTFSLIVHSSTLLHYATGQDFNSIPWEEWSSAARCFSGRTREWTSFSGQQLLGRQTEIWDFNQYHVKRLGKGFAVETETAHISVITKTSCVYVMDDESFYSSLPYVKTVPKRRWVFQCLDDDRIFAVSTYQFPPFIPLSDVIDNYDGRLHLLVKLSIYILVNSALCVFCPFLIVLDEISCFHGPMH